MTVVCHGMLASMLARTDLSALRGLGAAWYGWIGYADSTSTSQLVKSNVWTRFAIASVAQIFTPK